VSRQSLSVTVDRTGAGPDTLTTSEHAVTLEKPLEITLESVGSPAHVHCQLDGAVAAVASITPVSDPGRADGTGNVYVEPDSGTELLLDIDPMTLREPLEGTLVLSTGYGSVQTTVDLRLEPGPEPVTVDRTLGTPQRHEPEPTWSDRVLESVETRSGFDTATLGVFGLAVVAILLAWSTAAVIGGVAAYVGAGIVALGVVLAVALLSGVFESLEAPPR